MRIRWSDGSLSDYISVFSPRLSEASLSDQREAAAWLKRGKAAKHKGRLGTVMEPPDSDVDVVVQWDDDGKVSKHLKAVCVHPLTAAEEQARTRREAEAAASRAPGELCARSITHDQSSIIGRGSGAVVYPGTYTQDGRTLRVAIKRLDGAVSADDVRRFEQEIQVTLRASGKCSRACTVYGFMHEHTVEPGQSLVSACLESAAQTAAQCMPPSTLTLSLVMKRYEGSLHGLLDRQKARDGSVTALFNDTVLQQYTTQIAEGLAQLHAAGIVVQDLKPANLLLDERGELVICDFGLAAVISNSWVNSPSSSRTVGTPAYMAPEQIDKATFGEVSDKTDMWALGCVVIEMLTGAPPWQGKTNHEIMFEVAAKKKAPPIPCKASEPLGKLLTACFQHEQAKRWTAQKALTLLEQERLGGARERVQFEQALEVTSRRESEPEPEPEQAAPAAGEGGGVTQNPLTGAARE